MENFTIRMLTEDNAYVAGKMTVETQLRGNPPFINLGLDPNGVKMSDNFIKAIACSGHSYGAFHNDKLVGIRLGYIRHRGDNTIELEMEPLKNNSNTYYYEKFDEMAKLLEDNAKMFERYNVDCALHLYGLSVIDDYKRRGLGLKLTEYALDRAVEKGIRCFFTRSTGAFSARIFEKLGFEKLSEMAYDDFLGDDDQPVFRPAAPHKSMTMWAKFIKER